MVFGGKGGKRALRSHANLRNNKRACAPLVEGRAAANRPEGGTREPCDAGARDEPAGNCCRAPRRIRRARRCRLRAVYSVAECFNCHRRGDDLALRMLPRDSLHTTNRLYCTFSITVIESGGMRPFCRECATYVTSVPCDSDNWCVVWPAFMWGFLADTSPRSVCSVAGAGVAWTLVPSGWRHWWLASLVERVPLFWAVPGITIGHPPPVLDDVSSDLRLFEKMEDELKLGDIKRVCNELNFPSVLCCWGCSTFLQDVGTLPLPVVFHHFLRKRGVVVPMSSRCRKILPRVLSARPDYFDGNELMHICSKEFLVRPCLGFHRTEGMRVLTCSDHDGGTDKRYFHVPFSAVGLPAFRGDQLAHCVCHHRTVKPMVAKKYSSTYQLSHQRGSFAGIDMCCLKAKGDYSGKSSVQHNTEALSLACREDIRALLSQLEEDGHVHPATAAAFRRASDRDYPDGGLSVRAKYATGTTFMTVSDCMALQRELATVHEITLGESTFTPCWQRSVVWVHPYDSHGALPHAIPRVVRSIKHCDGRGLFLLMALATSVPLVWGQLAAGVTSGDDCIGYFLAFASKKVIPYHRGGKGRKEDPFTIAKEYTASEMIDKIGFPAFYDAPHVMDLLALGCGGSVVEFWEYTALYNPRDATVPFDVGGLTAGHRGFVTTRFRRDVTRSGVVLPASFVAAGVEFELRFFCLEPGGAGLTVCVRHGGHFVDWFSCAHDATEYSYEQPGFALPDAGECTFAVYVNNSPPSAKELRRDFLNYTGGQTTAVCEVHDAPLITVGVASCDPSHRCPGLPGGDRCGRSIYYKCPKRECAVCLCKRCLASLPEGETRELTLGHVVEAARVARQPDPDPPDEEGNEDDNASEDGNVSDASDESDESYIPPAEGEPDWYPSDDEADDVGDGRAVRFSDLHDGTDFMFFGDDAHGASDPPLFPELPRTVAHTNDIPSVEQDPRSDIAGNIVMLNGLGSCLVRTNFEINQSRANHEFLQSIIMSPTGRSVNLLQPESAVFPSVFPYDCPHDSSILGAIPSAFMSQEKNSNVHGIASVSDHARNRLFLPQSNASVDFRYQAFLFDQMVNNSMTDGDSRLILNRGVAESNTPAGLKVRSKDDHFFSDAVDNRQDVLNLTESQKYHASNLFITLTVNQKKMFGLSRIKDHLDSGGGLAHIEAVLGRELEAWEEVEYKQAIHDASCPLMTRCWLKVRKLLMTYIIYSLEEPFGRVSSAFWRDEYQGDMGNLSHIHGLLKIDYDSTDPDAVRRFRDVVRGFSADIIRVEEVPDLVAEGILKNRDDWYDTLEEARTILTHRSRRNQKRTGPGKDDVENRDGDIDWVRLSPDPGSHCTVRIDPGHKPEALLELHRCGLAGMPPPEDPWRFFGEHPILTCEKTMPPMREGEHNMSPVNGRLFAATRSMQNAQFVHGYSVNRYVTKYLTKIDEASHTVISANPKDGASVKANSRMLLNTKITSSAFNENKITKRDRSARGHPQGRLLARTEMIQLVSRDPQVHTTMEFKKVSTMPLEDRSGLHKSPDANHDRHKNVGYLRRYQEATGNNTFQHVVAPHWARKEHLLPEWRQFTDNQMLVINDNFYSAVTVCGITIFSVRPPELRELVPTLRHYFWWFMRVKPAENTLEDAMARIDPVLEDSEWVDGFGYTVLVRPAALEELHDYCRNRIQSFKEAVPAEMVGLINDIIGAYRISVGLDRGAAARDEPRWNRISALFVAPCRPAGRARSQHPPIDPLPIPVFSCVKPSNTTKFIYHILLSMGEYVTELDLLAQPTIRSSFEHANLVDATDEDSLGESVTALVGRYVVEQLAYYPVGTRTWDSYLLFAARTLRGAIIDGDLHINEMPACLYTELRREVLEKTRRELNLMRSNAIKAAYAELEGSLAATPGSPTLPALLDGSRVFDGRILASAGQSRASYDEQERTREMVRHTYNEYTDPRRSTLAKSLMIAGGPGNGKTHCLMYASLYYNTNKRFLMPCAILADRARAIGGLHFHRLFKCPVGNNSTAHRYAERSVVNILRDPVSLEFILSVDALGLDESGTMSSTLLSSLDMIFRRVRGVSTYMGGVMLVTTIDDKQLRPVKGYPFLLSPNILTCFRVVMLSQSVRSALDPDQQRVIEISRYSEREMLTNPHCIDEAVALISHRCNFVASFDHPSVSRSALRLFGRKAPAEQAVRDYYRSIEHGHAVGTGHAILRTKLAEDVQIAVESHGRHTVASARVSESLTRHCKEPPKLLFFLHAVYQFTYNDPSGAFTQSRLAILVDVPSAEQVDRGERVRVHAAPPGVKSAPLVITGRRQLEEEGWREVSVGMAPERTHTFKRLGVRAKRRMYGLRPFVSATLHSIQGATLVKIVTCIAWAVEEMRLWEKAQFLVLISRTHFLSDIYFVGDKAQTMKTVRKCLRMRSQFDEYTEHVLRVAAGMQSEAPTLTFSTHPYRPRDNMLSYDGSGACYLLVSSENWTRTYIGKTVHLERRLAEHNSGQGAVETRTGRPWVLVAFVQGFGGCNRSMLHFENDWQLLGSTRVANSIARRGGARHMDVYIEAAEFIVEGRFNRRGGAYSDKSLSVEVHADILEEDY